MKPYEIALKEYGISEQQGRGSNPAVLKYYQKIGQNWVTEDSDVAWCAAFTGYCLETAGLPSTRALKARSYLNWHTPTITPKMGDVAVFWRISPMAAEGHVGFFITNDANGIWVLGGNQSDQVSIIRMPYKQLLGYRTV